MRDAVAEGARVHPARLALDDGGAGYSWRDLDAAADRLARRLAELGVRAGEAVGMLAATGPEAVMAMYAVPRAGAALAPLNPTLARRELRDSLAVVRPAVVLCDAAHVEVARRVLGDEVAENEVAENEAAGKEAGKAPPRLAVLAAGVSAREVRVFAPGEGARSPGRSVPAGIRRAAASGAPLAGVGPDAVVALLRTSGTGGEARAVALTRRNFDASARAVGRRLDLHPDDAWYASLSLAHIGGMALVHRALAAGSRVVVRGAYRREVLVELIEAGRITHVSLVPTMLGRLLDAGLPRPIPASLRCVLVGGTGAPPPLVERALAAGLPVALTYGMTEACSQVASAPPALVRAKPGTAGPPLDGAELRIAPDGEIEVCGEMVARAYHPGDRAEAGVVGEKPMTGRDGWYCTGDLGRLDSDCHLCVAGRKSHRIVSGGVNVEPAEVERVFAAHPGVAEAAVVGLPDPEWGERVAAGVVPARGCDLRVDALLAHCREGLGPAARPGTLVVLDALPRNPNGKVDRARLAALLQGSGRSGDVVA